MVVLNKKGLNVGMISSKHGITLAKVSLTGIQRVGAFDLPISIFVVILKYKFNLLMMIRNIIRGNIKTFNETYSYLYILRVKN